MYMSIRSRCLIVTSCLALSACTETITREIVVSADPLTPEPTVVTPSVSGGVAMIPVTPVLGTDANMVTDPETPAVVTPVVTTPVVTTPSVTTPVVTTPAVTTPVVTTPVVTTPVVTTPAVTTPVVTTPVVTTPAVTTPVVTTPVVTTPVVTDPVDTISTPETPVVSPLLDPQTATTVGAPGLEVDCEQTVPCQWLSDDLQFALTVTNADNIATLSRLSISYSITTAHDTQVFVSRAEDAHDGNGVIFKAADQSLGGGNGGTPQGVVAGTALQGVLNFDASSTSTSISQWSIAILDGGLLRLAKFTNLPVGTVTTAKADCLNTLPCIWTTPTNDVAITLLSVGGISIGSRLTANFSIETTVNTAVAVDAGSSAYGSEGTVFEGRTHTIVADTNFEKVSATAIAGVPLYGSVNFFRTVSVPSSLQQMSLIIYPDQPVPRWNPQFLNVPVQ